VDLRVHLGHAPTANTGVALAARVASNRINLTLLSLRNTSALGHATVSVGEPHARLPGAAVPRFRILKAAFIRACGRLGWGWLRFGRRADLASPFDTGCALATRIAELFVALASLALANTGPLGLTNVPGWEPYAYVSWTTVRLARLPEYAFVGALLRRRTWRTWRAATSIDAVELSTALVAVDRTGYACATFGNTNVLATTERYLWSPVQAPEAGATVHL